MKTDHDLKEQVRLLVYKDGVCFSSTDLLDSDKITISKNGQYHMLIGSNGPCTMALNVGGKIFRARHDEVAKGLL